MKFSMCWLDAVIYICKNSDHQNSKVPPHKCGGKQEKTQTGNY